MQHENLKERRKREDFVIIFKNLFRDYTSNYMSVHFYSMYFFFLFCGDYYNINVTQRCRREFDGKKYRKRVWRCCDVADFRKNSGHTRGGNFFKIEKRNSAEHACGSHLRFVTAATRRACILIFFVLFLVFYARETPGTVAVVIYRHGAPRRDIAVDIERRIYKSTMWKRVRKHGESFSLSLLYQPERYFGFINAARYLWTRFARAVITRYRIFLYKTLRTKEDSK